MIKITPRAARTNAGMTQAEVALNLGVTRETVKNYETGRTKIPLEMAMKMADLYKIPMENIKFF